MAVVVSLLLLSVLSAAARERPPEVPPPKPIVLPMPQVRVLPNGLTLVVIERRSLPVLTLRFVVKSGAETDPPNLPGLAQMTAEVLSQGTARRDARQIAESVDTMGGSLDTGAGWDDSFAELTVLSQYHDLAFDLINDLVRHPAFAAEELDRKRKQTISALEVLRDDPAFTADAILRVLIFSGTPYGHPTDGTEESVRRITTRDLAAFHAQHYAPANCILAVAGDITADTALQFATRSFGDWMTSSLPEHRAVADRQHVTRRRMVIVDKPDAVQTEIRVGHEAIERSNPDYVPLTVANQVLGGPAANRLFKTLRSRLGLAYGASSDLTCEQAVGSWVASTSTRTSGTARSLEAILDEIDRLGSHSISSDELRTAKSYLIGHMALEFETSADIAQQTLELMVHGLPLDYWNQFPEKLTALDAQQVYAASRRYLDPGRDVIVLVGSAAEFSNELGKYGPLEVIPIQELDLASPNLRRKGASAE